MLKIMYKLSLLLVFCLLNIQPLQYRIFLYSVSKVIAFFSALDELRLVAVLKASEESTALLTLLHLENDIT